VVIAAGWPCHGSGNQQLTVTVCCYCLEANQGGRISATGTIPDFRLKLCTMIIYIYIYSLEALERKLWTLQRGGGGGGLTGLAAG
jgi:hypothetical protein